MLEPVTFDGAKLGKQFWAAASAAAGIHLVRRHDGQPIDIPHLRKFGRSFRSTLRSLRLMSHYALQRLRAPRGTTLHLGNALAATALRLAAGPQRRDPVRHQRRAIADRRRRRSRRADHRIHPASGRSPRAGAWCWRPADFSHDAGLREKFFPAAAGLVSATTPAGTGDGLRLATGCRRRASARAWRIRPIGCRRRCFRRADGSQGVFPHTVTDRAKPGVIAVNAAGRRFVNEALSYHEFVRAMLADGNDSGGSFVLPRLRPAFSLELRAWSYQAVYLADRSDTSEAAN